MRACSSYLLTPLVRACSSYHSPLARACSSYLLTSLVRACSSYLLTHSPLVRACSSYPFPPLAQACSLCPIHKVHTPPPIQNSKFIILFTQHNCTLPPSLLERGNGGEELRWCELAARTQFIIPPPLAQACSLCPIHKVHTPPPNSKFKIQNFIYTAQLRTAPLSFGEGEWQGCYKVL